ncbi:MAG: hypothetical protein ACTSRG_21325 [Candidatus Helarchaeota archaeon]
MLHNIFILGRRSGITLFEHQINPFDTDSRLIGGLLATVQMFCQEIHIGELTTFRTNRFQVIISVRNQVIVALFLDKNDNEDFWQFRAFEIGHTFENQYKAHIENFRGDISQFDNFKLLLEKILSKEEDSYLFQILKWIKKDCNGDLHICNSNPIDITIDLGQKLNFHSFKNLIFIKLFENKVDKSNIQNLLSYCQNLGFKQQNYKIDSAFPSKLMIIGNDFDANLINYLNKELPTYNKKHFFISKRLDSEIKEIRETANIFNCYIELWKYTNEFHKLIFS